MRLAKGKVHYVKARLKHGPWHGREVLIPSTGSLVFAISGERGRYMEPQGGFSYWEEVPLAVH